MRFPRFITERLLDRMEAVMASRPADVLIGRDANGLPYMTRWHVIPRNRFFNIYLHRYYHDDDRILHSHPWWSVSICLIGVLTEYFTRTSDGANRPETHAKRFVDNGDVVFRSADMFHRLEVCPGATTIFITGPKIKTWYFACKRGLIEWTQFVSKRDKGEIGAGCGEDDNYPTNH